MPQLSIVSACVDDYDGVFFTYQALHRYHTLPTDTEFLVVDNARRGCMWTNDAMKKLNGRYIHSPSPAGTAYPRDLAITEAKGDIVICLDCHVLVAPGGIGKIIRALEVEGSEKHMIQGPMTTDHRDLSIVGTHFDDVWGEDGMWGKWGKNDACISECVSIEIPMQGLGLFAMRREAFPRFNPNFRGFGGEEGYIHEKVRMNGGKCWCHPGVTWTHRTHLAGQFLKYANTLQDRFSNYAFGHRELGLDMSRCVRAYKGKVADDFMAKTMKYVESVQIPGKQREFYYGRRRDEQDQGKEA